MDWGYRFSMHLQTLLDGNRLGEIPGEIDIKILRDSEPVSDELEGKNVQESLETINS